MKELILNGSPDEVHAQIRKIREDIENDVDSSGNTVYTFLNLVRSHIASRYFFFYSQTAP